MLGRQWQVGEHAGEDAASPVLVELEVAHTPLDPVAGIDPKLVPAEALLEGAGEDWWTVGRRARVGRAASAGLSAEQRAANAFSILPEPYGDTLAGEVDGLALWRAGLIDAGDPALAGFSPRPDFWQSETLTYETEVTAGGATLRVTGHDGGDVDWFTADADAAAAASRPRQAAGRAAAAALPGRSGAALVADRGRRGRHRRLPARPVAPGDGSADRADLRPRERLVHRAGAVAGTAARRRTLRRAPAWSSPWARRASRTASTTGGTLTIPPGDDDPPAAPDEAPGPWSLFRTAGLDRSSLVVWPTATTPHLRTRPRRRHPRRRRGCQRPLGG